MKITLQLLSIPPYITTSWDNVVSLQADRAENAVRQTLVVTLGNDEKVRVPDLNNEDVECAMEMYGKFIERLESSSQADSSNATMSLAEMFQQMMNDERSLAPGLGLIKIPIQHSPSQKGLPLLDKRSLKNIIRTLENATGSSRSILFACGFEDTCNCVYCQVCKMLQTESFEKDLEKENLNFSNIWLCNATGKDKFIVRNKSTLEEFEVLLKPDITCSCGLSNCIHIKTILLS